MTYFVDHYKKYNESLSGASSMTADAEAVSNAFSAVMRGNFTLIDNLRLGIKGSK